MKKVLAVLAFMVLCSSAARAHPWGGLVIDMMGNIYFTFICPTVDDDHYACVWKIDSNLALSEALNSRQSPSDIILARSPDRQIYGAERFGQHGNYRNRLWQIRESGNSMLLDVTDDDGGFVIQAYTVSGDGTIYYSDRGEIFYLNENSEPVRLNHEINLDRVQLLERGPGGSLYILADNNLYRYDDGSITMVAEGLKEESPANLPFRGANIFFDMVVTEDKEVYLAYYGDRKIIKVNPDGTQQTVLQAKAPWSPHGIDVFNGEIYVLESTLGDGRWWEFWKSSDTEIIPRIRKIDSDGNLSVVYNYTED